MATRVLIAALLFFLAHDRIDEATLNIILKEICNALIQADVNVQFVMGLRKNIKKICDMDELTGGTNKRKLIQRAVFNELVGMLDSGKDAFKPKKGKCNVIMFVGLQGSGKTTTIAKFAHYYKKRGWKTCMVCADTFRAGAFDQLKQNATRVRVPFYGDYTEKDPVRIAEDGVGQFRREKYEIIILDTSGRHKQEAELFDEMEQLQAVVEPDDVVFVMDSTIGQAVTEQATAFKRAVDIGSVVITKLDGHAKGGGAISAVAATESPIIFIGTGEHFDEFETFEARAFVSRLLGMGDMKGLMETFVETGVLDNQEEVVKKFAQGQFSLRDMREQFANVMKMGNLSQVVSMIPGMSFLMPKGKEREGENNIQMFMTIMDSMSEDELDGRLPGKEKTLNTSRILRIARGSGTTPQMVQLLLGCHKKFEKMVSKMGKTGLMKGGDAAMARNMARNPNAMMQQLSRCMDPRMLAQMGGAGNMMNMMKQMGNMDMGEIMKQMGGMGGMGGKKGRRR